jgi:magnesium-transporting ATPase (P-type)
MSAPPPSHICVQLLAQNDAVVHDAPWEFVGYFALFDPPRVDSKRVLNVATNMGLHVKMITGDQQYDVLSDTCF